MRNASQPRHRRHASQTPRTLPRLTPGPADQAPPALPVAARPTAAMPSQNLPATPSIARPQLGPPPNPDHDSPAAHCQTQACKGMPTRAEATLAKPA